ncbi:MAG: zinc ribbon domain-containing protein, partial [Clostridia bacterium]|nr:zinc ribbon domain-containing protein [Clostridia bacterium]
MKCINCGNELEDNAKFCASCGNAVEEVKPVV